MLDTGSVLMWVGCISSMFNLPQCEIRISICMLSCVFSLWVDPDVIGICKQLIGKRILFFLKGNTHLLMFWLFFTYERDVRVCGVAQFMKS